jgi:predicted dehydrogenase
MTQRKKVSRRTLLKGAAGVLAVPYFVPASALGRGGWLPPSERITVGFIGIGNMGGGHLGGFLDDKEVQVVAVCDVRRDVREGSKKKVEDKYAADRQAGTFKGCEDYNNFEDLLARPHIDAVLIAVPDHWHATIGCAAARAGKDIYSEKPLTLTIKEAWELVATVRRYGRVFQTGSQQRSEGNFRLACELVQSGRIGKLQTVTVNIGEPSQEAYLPEQPIPDGFDWNRWLGPAPVQPYNAERCSGNYGGGWRKIRDYSGGMTTDWGAHHYDIAQWGMGMDGNGPVEIIPPNGKDVEHMTFKYANGVVMQRAQANGVLFTGTEGEIEVNRGYFQATPKSIAEEPLGPKDVHLYNSPGHRQDWINCIRSRKRPICDVAIGASSVTVCHLSNIAYWLGRPIKWDPAKKEIIGDSEATRWLDRPKRAPWRL